jgi:hypothetical protein
MILKSPDNNLVQISVVGICRHPKCRRYHRITAKPDLFGQLAFDWQYKHDNCELEHPGSVEFLSPQRFIPRGFDDRVFEDTGVGPQWLDWHPNADVKISYVADAALTMDLSNLASSATFVAGRESTWVANSSNYLDYRISGTFISGTTPTAPAEHRLYYLSATEDTPTYPDVFDGTDSAETLTNTNIRDSLVLGWSGTASTSSNITYPIISALTMAQAFGVCPKNWGVFFTHAHTAALKTDAGNTNSLFQQGIYATVT